MEKTYKRETAIGLLVVMVLAMLSTGAWLLYKDQYNLVIDLLNTYITLVMAFSAGAFGLDWWSKQNKSGS